MSTSGTPCEWQHSRPFFWSPHLSILKDIFSWVCQILQRGIFQSPALGQVEVYISEATSIPEAAGKGTEYLLLVMQYFIYFLHCSCHLLMEPLWFKVSGEYISWLVQRLEGSKHSSFRLLINPAVFSLTLNTWCQRELVPLAGFLWTSDVLSCLSLNVFLPLFLTSACAHYSDTWQRREGRCLSQLPIIHPLSIFSQFW